MTTLTTFNTTDDAAAAKGWQLISIKAKGDGTFVTLCRVNPDRADRMEYATHRYNPRYNDFYWGHYFIDDVKAAWADLETR